MKRTSQRAPCCDAAKDGGTPVGHQRKEVAAARHACAAVLHHDMSMLLAPANGSGVEVLYYNASKRGAQSAPYFFYILDNHSSRLIPAWYKIRVRSAGPISPRCGFGMVTTTSPRTM